MRQRNLFLKFGLVLALIALSGLSLAQTTLRIMSSTIVESPEGDVEQAIADAFMAENPDITIEFIGTPMNDMFKVLTTNAIGGELPDIFTNTPEFAAQAADLGIAADLYEVFDEDFLAGFYPTTLEEATVDGKLILLPWFTVPVGVLYRADWFEEAGLEGPQTWDDFVNAAQTLTQDTDGDGRWTAGVLPWSAPKTARAFSALPTCCAARVPGSFIKMLRVTGKATWVQKAWSTPLESIKTFMKLARCLQVSPKRATAKPLA